MKRVLSSGVVVALSVTILTLLFTQLGESSAAGPRLPAAPAMPAPPPVLPFGTPPPSFVLADVSNTLFSGPNTPTRRTFSPFPQGAGRFFSPPFPIPIVATPFGLGPFFAL